MYRLPLAATIIMLSVARSPASAQVADGRNQAIERQVYLITVADSGPGETSGDVPTPSQDVPVVPPSSPQAPTSQGSISKIPDQERVLSESTELHEAVDRLFDQGYDPGELGSPAMTKAARDFEARAGLPQSDKATARLLDALRATPTPTPWGAVAFGPHMRRFGLSWNLPSRREALSHAQASCGTADCDQVLAFYGTHCGALATSSIAYFISSRDDEDHARADALNKCEMRGPTCHVILSACANGSVVSVRP